MELKLKSKTHGDRCVYFDDEDFEKIKKYHWILEKRKKRWYSRTSVWVSTNKYKYIYMHRFIMDAPIDMQVDHRDHDGLNNRRSNLRLTPVIGGQNVQNIGVPINSTTGFKGVYLYTKGQFKGKYSAKIVANGTKIWGGYFDTAVEAAQRVNELCKIHHKEFACLNQFSEEDQKLLDSLPPSGVPLTEIKKYLKPLMRGVSTPISATQKKPYMANITINGEKHYLGYFKSEIDAAKAYNEALLKFGGNQVFLNKIPNDRINGPRIDAIR